MSFQESYGGFAPIPWKTAQNEHVTSGTAQENATGIEKGSENDKNEENSSLK